MAAPGTLRAALATLGCRVNFSETDHLRAVLQAAGYTLVDFAQEADLYVVNTCTVTHVADRKSRQLLRRAARRNPQALIVAVGCYADVAGPALAALPEVDLVLNQGQEAELVERLAEALRARGHEAPLGQAGRAGRLLPANPARALIKVQDGCDHRCAYCIVRLARGASRSRPSTEVVAEVQEVCAAGYGEIVLTGVNLGAYRDAQVGDLAGLARRLLEETSARRIRFSSIEPQDFPLRLLDLWPEPRLCRHFHLPLQSGCDRTLARMGRLYRFADFAALVEAIRRRLPQAGLTTDVIVGFPGESGDEFEESMAAIASLPLSDLHIFPFSPRPGTAAFEMPDTPPAPLRHERCRQMQVLATRMARAFRQHFIGQELSVLWDGHTAQGWTGLSDNYLRVVTASAGLRLGQVTPTRITALEGTALRGETAAVPGNGPIERRNSPARMPAPAGTGPATGAR